MQLVLINIASVSIFSNSRRIEIFYSLLLQLMLNFKICQFCTWFLLFHLSYYSISYRIKNLTLFIGSQCGQIKDTHTVAVVSTASFPSSQRAKAALRTCGYLFDQICQATHEINLHFSLSILMFLTFVMISCSTCLFFIIYVMVDLVDHPSIIEFFSIFPPVFSLGVFVTLVLLMTADFPIKQVHI